MKICFGEHNTAIEHEPRAMRLSPLDPFLWAWHFFTALAHFFAGRPEDAASCVEASLRERLVAVDEPGTVADKAARHGELPEKIHRRHGMAH